ncbi:MAG: hypothetical protein KY462_06065 [Actinobacteria bacterium]|nr:hypothetical protein [Actinomycetota bacterium]
MLAPIRRTATTLASALVSALAVAVLLAGPVGADEAPLSESPPADPPAPRTEVTETDATQAAADAVEQAVTAAQPEAVDTILDAAEAVADQAPAPVGDAVRTVTAMAREAAAPTTPPPAPVPADRDDTRATGGPVTDLGAVTVPAAVRPASSVPIGATSLTGLRLDQAQIRVAEADLAAFTSPDPALAAPITGTSAPLPSVPIDRAHRILAEILFGAALLVVATAALVGELGPDRRSAAA